MSLATFTQDPGDGVNVGTLMGSPDYEDFDLSHSHTPGVDSALADVQEAATALVKIDGRDALASPDSTYSGFVVPTAFGPLMSTVRDALVNRDGACSADEKAMQVIKMVGDVTGAGQPVLLGSDGLSAPLGGAVPRDWATARGIPPDLFHLLFPPGLSSRVPLYPLPAMAPSRALADLSGWGSSRPPDHDAPDIDIKRYQ